MSTSCFTWGVGQEAARVELQLLHEADLSILTETVEVPLTQNKDGSRGVGEGGHWEVQGLFSKDDRPVGLEEETQMALQQENTIQNNFCVFTYGMCVKDSPSTSCLLS